MTSRPKQVTVTVFDQAGVAGTPSIRTASSGSGPPQWYSIRWRAIFSSIRVRHAVLDRHATSR